MWCIRYKTNELVPEFKAYSKNRKVAVPLAARYWETWSVMYRIHTRRNYCSASPSRKSCNTTKSIMFFGGGGSRRSRGPRKGPSINHPLKVSLEDLYNGKTVKLAVNRKVIVGDVRECAKCDGQGAVMEVRQIGPGMITQVQRHCDSCGGQGTMAVL